MNRLRILGIAGILVLLLASASLVSAERGSPPGQPPSPQMLEEITASHGAALLKYYPQYAALAVPVTGSSYYFRQHIPPTASMIEEISRTRGAALAVYWQK